MHFYKKFLPNYSPTAGYSLYEYNNYVEINKNFNSSRFNADENLLFILYQYIIIITLVFSY